MATALRNTARTVGRLPDSFYPNPFLDVANTYMPKSIKELYDLCLFYQMTNPIIHTVTNKLATYPITDLLYEEENEGLVEKFRTLFEDQFRIRQFIVEVNLDRYTYGISHVTVAFPFIKMLTCPSCGESKKVSDSKYKWKDLKFHSECTSCGFVGTFKVKDETVKSERGVRLIRWDPRNITVSYNEITGKTKYYYDIPQYIRNDVILGKADVLEEIPQAFIDAIRDKKAILLDSNKVFSSRRSTPSRGYADGGSGVPLILPVLKDIFLLQILRKSEEAVALEHIVPMRALFPQVRTDGDNPYAQINLQDWKREVESQVKMWKADTNYMPVMPIPLGYQLIGGQGKAYLLHQEIRMYTEIIVAGLGVPVGFYYGEAQFSGAAVNLRALENEFLGNRQDMLRLVEFIRDKICEGFGFKKIALRFKPFKMADDIQKAMLESQMVDKRLMSGRSFCQARDLNYDAEQRMIKKEIAQKLELQREESKLIAEIQGESSLVANRYAMEVQASQMQQSAELQAQYGPPPGAEGADGAPGGEGAGGGKPAKKEGGGGGGEKSSDKGKEAGDKKPEKKESSGQPGKQHQGAAESQTKDGLSLDVMAQADHIAKQLGAADEFTRYSTLSQLQGQMPELYVLVNKKMQEAAGKGGTMKPLSEQRPPRSSPANAAI